MRKKFVWLTLPAAFAPIAPINGQEIAPCVHEARFGLAGLGPEVQRQDDRFSCTVHKQLIARVEKANRQGSVRLRRGEFRRRVPWEPGAPRAVPRDRAVHASPSHATARPLPGCHSGARDLRRRHSSPLQAPRVPRTRELNMMKLHARLMLSGLAVAAFGALVGMMLPGGAVAQTDPWPGASQRVLDQNLDGNGLIGGHERGTASVNVDSCDRNGAVKPLQEPAVEDTMPGPRDGSVTSVTRVERPMAIPSSDPPASGGVYVQEKTIGSPRFISGRSNSLAAGGRFAQ